MLNYEFPPLGGGASPVSYEIAKGLVELSHSVDVVTMGFKGFPRFEIVDGINVYRVKCLRKKKEICTSPEMLSYVLSAKRFLRKHLKNNKYDINYTHFIIPSGILSLWAKNKFGLKYIITSHGSDVIGYNPRFNKIYPVIAPLWKKIVRNAKLITTPSLFLQKEIKKIIPEYNNFKVIPNGIDPNRIKPMEKEKMILLCSRLFVNKGVQDFLDGIKGLNLKDWKVNIVGDGPYKEELIKKAKKNKVSDKVNFVGWLDNNSKEYKEYYGKASIFVCPSYFESFGMIVAEAMQAGCALLLSDIDTFTQDFKDSGCFYFRKQDSLDLKNKLNNLINDSEKIKEVQKKSLKTSEKYYWRNIIQNHNDLLKNN